MLGTQNLSTFILASFLLWITPGPDTLYVLARSIAQGRQAGWLSALGSSTGLLVHTTFAAFGLSTILATSAFAFTLVKIAGAGYLIYLGLEALLKKSQPAIAPETPLMNSWQLYRQGLVTNVFNPKVAIFFLAFLPQFVDPSRSLGALPFLLLGIFVTLGATVWCLIIAAFASKATQTIRSNSRMSGWLQRLAGCLYITLGLNLLKSKVQPT